MKKTLLYSLLLTAFASAHASTNIVLDGSFEAQAQANGTWSLNASLPDWTLVSGPSIELRDNVAGTAADGVNYVELDSTANSAISQVLNTTVGQTYVLSFEYSNRTGTNPSTDGLYYSLNGVQVDAPALPENDTSNNLWSTYSTNFTATSNSTTLVFGALGTSDSYGSSLDNIQVSAVPEPSSYALMFGGLGLMGFVARRRAQR